MSKPDCNECKGELIATYTHTYYCIFSFHGQDRIVDSDAGMVRFTEGFWLNDKFELAKGSDCKWFIPYHKVKYIQKQTSKNIIS